MILRPPRSTLFPYRRSSDLFWNDQQRAAKLSSEHQRTQQKLQRYDELVSNVEFLREGVGTFPDADLEPTLRQVQTELRSEEHTSELQSLRHLVCRLLLEKKK